MEQNRRGIYRQIAPTVALRKTIFKAEVGEKGAAEGVFTVARRKVELDQDGNEVIKVILKVNSLKGIDAFKTRIT